MAGQSYPDVQSYSQLKRLIEKKFNRQKESSGNFFAHL